MSQVVEKRAHKPAAVLKDSDFVWQDPLDLDGDDGTPGRESTESCRPPS